MERAVIHTKTRVVHAFTIHKDVSQLNLDPNNYSLIEFKDPLKLQKEPNTLLKIDGLGNLDKATVDEAVEAKHIAVSGIRTRRLRDGIRQALDAIEAANTPAEGLAAMKAFAQAQKRAMEG